MSKTSTKELSISFYDAESKNGLQNLSFAVRVDGVERRVSYQSSSKNGENITLKGEILPNLINCETEINKLNDKCIIFKHRLINLSENRNFALSDLKTLQTESESGVSFGSTCNNWDLRFCHSDNLRIEKFPHCQMNAPYVKILPEHPTLFGTGEDQPFPGIYFTHRDYKHGLVIASATQDKTYQNYFIQRIGLPSPYSAFSCFEIQHELPLCHEYHLDAGTQLELDGTYVEILEDTHPEDAFEHYLAYLADNNDFRGKNTHILDEAMYCSWNYGRFSEQTVDTLLPTAKFIAEKLPNIKYFLIDAGYTKGVEGQWGGVRNNFNDAFYPEPNDAVNPDRFPNGMKAFADEIRALGLKPSLWWSPTTRIDSKIYEDHPDWFLRRKDGELYLIGDTQGFLDLSHDGARAFMDKVLSVVLGEWGMEALKMDFWSHQFEDRHIAVGKRNHTAIDNRNILFDLVRKHLPDDGIFMTCVAVGMGNPFLATHADTFRNTIDIGKGDWREQIHTSYWALPSLAKAGRQTYLHNNDSAGIYSESTQDENFFRLTWCWITMGIQEMGGYFEKLESHYVEAIKKFTDRCDRGHRCLCPDEKAWRGEPLPEILYVNYPEDSQSQSAGISQSIAFFNWSDETQIISIERKRLSQSGPVSVEDFWTGEQSNWSDDFISLQLAPRSSKLFDVLKA